jgi:hypothetical protein
MAIPVTVHVGTTFTTDYTSGTINLTGSGENDNVLMAFVYHSTVSTSENVENPTMTFANRYMAPLDFNFVNTTTSRLFATPWILYDPEDSGVLTYDSAHGENGNQAIQIIELQGVKEHSEIDVIAELGQNNVTSAGKTENNVTTTEDNTLVLTAWAQSGDTSPGTASVNSGWTLENSQTPDSSNTGYLNSVGLASRFYASASTTTGAEVNWSGAGSTSDWQSITLAVVEGTNNGDTSGTLIVGVI